MSFDRLKRPTLSFTQVPNDLICSPFLSCKAKTVYCYLISRPDDWKFYTKEIVKNMKESIDTVNSAINELIASGWIEKELIRVGGKFSHSVYTMYYEVLTVKVKTVHGKTTHDETAHGFLPSTNTNSTNTKRNNTDTTSSRSDFSFNSFREEFILKYKHGFHLSDCKPWSKDTLFKIDDDNKIFNTVSNKLINKDDAYIVWNYLYEKFKNKNQG
ncbi:MAG: helix-turn-helix domain-containing protein [Campylobacterales bacterium]|nr:helix-turn-helix domain-containing protein [Campylobacterales bacterium]